MNAGHGDKEQTLKVMAAPVIREALGEMKAGEDFDEALLRVLKARHPEHATALLSAITRVIELDGKRAYEDKQQTIRRLSEADPGPEVVLRSSGGESPRVVTSTRAIRVDGKDAASLEELPPHVRAAVEKRMSEVRAGRRPGCALGLVSALLGLIARATGR